MCSLNFPIRKVMKRSSTLTSMWLFIFLDFFECEYGPFFNVFIESVTPLLLFCVLAFRPRGIWHLTWDCICTPCIGK